MKNLRNFSLRWTVWALHTQLSIRSVQLPLARSTLSLEQLLNQEWIAIDFLTRLSLVLVWSIEPRELVAPSKTLTEEPEAIDRCFLRTKFWKILFWNQKAYCNDVDRGIDSD